MKHFLCRLLAVVVAAFPLAASAAEGQIPADEASVAAGRDELLIIDVRTPTEWRGTGIPAGSKTAEFGSPAFLRTVTDAVLSDRSRPIALICRSGNRSTKAKQALEANGFTHVLNISEGMSGSGAGPGWLKRGLPVSPCPDCR